MSRAESVRGETMAEEQEKGAGRRVQQASEAEQMARLRREVDREDRARVHAEEAHRLAAPVQLTGAASLDDPLAEVEAIQQRQDERRWKAEHTNVAGEILTNVPGEVHAVRESDPGTPPRTRIVPWKPDGRVRWDEGMGDMSAQRIQMALSTTLGVLDLLIRNGNREGVPTIVAAANALAIGARILAEEPPASEHEKLWAWLFAARDVTAPCGGCHGLGVRTYGTTATYRRGAGGMTPTVDVCNQCWGSGDARKTWPPRADR